MAVSQETIDYLVDQLSDFGSVIARRMFGGVGIFRDGLMFALIGHGELYFKVDDGNRKDFEDAGMAPFRPYPDKDEIMPYYRVPADIVEDREALKVWANKAYDVALRKKAAKR